MKTPFATLSWLSNELSNAVGFPLCYSSLSSDMFWNEGVDENYEDDDWPEEDV